MDYEKTYKKLHKMLRDLCKDSVDLHAAKDIVSEAIISGEYEEGQVDEVELALTESGIEAPGVERVLELLRGRFQEDEE